MSRNIKLNSKNRPSKFFLKNVCKQSTNNSNEFNLSPLHMKKNPNITNIEYLSFCTNESTNKSNKKNVSKKKNKYFI